MRWWIILTVLAPFIALALVAWLSVALYRWRQRRTDEVARAAAIDVYRTMHGPANTDRNAPSE